MSPHLHYSSLKGMFLCSHTETVIRGKRKEKEQDRLILKRVQERDSAQIKKYKYIYQVLLFLSFQTYVKLQYKWMKTKSIA